MERPLNPVTLPIVGKIKHAGFIDRVTGFSRKYFHGNFQHRGLYEGNVVGRRNFKGNVASPHSFFEREERPWNCIAREVINNREQYDTSRDIDFKPTVDTYRTHKARWSAFSYAFLKATFSENYVRSSRVKAIRDSEEIPSPDEILRTGYSIFSILDVHEILRLRPKIIITNGRNEYPTDVDEYS